MHFSSDWQDKDVVTDSAFMSKLPTVNQCYCSYTTTSYRVSYVGVQRESTVDMLLEALLVNRSADNNNRRRASSGAFYT